jgi:DNA-binding phage protein
MTKLLKGLLRPDYLIIIKQTMMEKHHNNTSLARETGFSKTHIGNVMKGLGSDDAISAVCKVLNIPIRSLFKEDPRGENQDMATA